MLRTNKPTGRPTLHTTLNAFPSKIHHESQSFSESQAHSWMDITSLNKTFQVLPTCDQTPLRPFFFHYFFIAAYTVKNDKQPLEALKCEQTITNPALYQGFLGYITLHMGQSKRFRGRTECCLTGYIFTASFDSRRGELREVLSFIFWSFCLLE